MTIEPADETKKDKPTIKTPYAKAKKDNNILKHDKMAPRGAFDKGSDAGAWQISSHYVLCRIKNTPKYTLPHKNFAKSIHYPLFQENCTNVRELYKCPSTCYPVA